MERVQERLVGENMFCFKERGGKNGVVAEAEKSFVAKGSIKKVMGVCSWQQK